MNPLRHCFRSNFSSLLLSKRFGAYKYNMGVFHIGGKFLNNFSNNKGRKEANDKNKNSLKQSRDEL